MPLLDRPAAVPGGPPHRLSVCLSVWQAEDMINQIRSAFKSSLDRLAWMDEQTRQAAKDKVSEQTDRLVTDSSQEDRQVVEVLLLHCPGRPMRSTT